MTNPSTPGPGDKSPANERMRHPGPNVIDQRQQQIDPAGTHRDDPDARPDANRKQPGGSIRDGQRIATDDDRPIDEGPQR